MNTASQAYIFLVFISLGFIIGIIFDIFRVLRRSFKTSDFITYIEDILFWIISGIVTLYTIFKFNNGEIRGYIVIGIILGGSLYLGIFSKVFIKVSVKIIEIIKKIIVIIIKVITFPVRKIISIFVKPINFVFINVSKSIKNIFKTKPLSNLNKKGIIKKKNKEKKKDFA